MSAQRLIEKLTKRGIGLMVDGERLIWVAPKGRMTPDLLLELRTIRGEVLAVLSQTKPTRCAPSSGASADPTCSPHNDAANYVDAPAPGAKLRTTCRRCGRFLGYRPSSN